MIRTRAVAPPADSALAPLYAGADLADAYAVALPNGATDDIAALARAVLGRPPEWVKPLMVVRNGVMSAFGVKTSAQIARGGLARGDEVISSFPVRERHTNEVVVGEDDRHLDFRTSVLVRDAGAGRRELLCVTVVHCRSRLGRLYLAVITPFHRVIVPAYLNRAARNGWPTSLGAPLGPALTGQAGRC